MEGERFLTEYMRDFGEEYILIGGNACALQFEKLDVIFRATLDLDIVLVTESTRPEFYSRLTEFLEENNYEGKRFRGSNRGGSAYRFILPGEMRGQGLPVQIELFAKKPEYFDETKSSKLHITPIEAGEGISNFSAMLLDDDIYQYIRDSRESVRGITTVNLPCLFGLKSVAWHNNQTLQDEGEAIDDDTIFKHPADMLRIVSVVDAQEVLYPTAIFESLQRSSEMMQEADVRARIPLSDGMDFDETRDYISQFVKQQPSA
ncbi:hypothetical protein ACQVA2_21935 (plasmid) [Citrobacter sp. OP27]